MFVMFLEYKMRCITGNTADKQISARSLCTGLAFELHDHHLQKHSRMQLLKTTECGAPSYWWTWKSVFSNNATDVRAFQSFPFWVIPTYLSSCLHVCMVLTIFLQWYPHLMQTSGPHWHPPHGRANNLTLMQMTSRPRSETTVWK